MCPSGRPAVGRVDGAGRLAAFRPGIWTSCRGPELHGLLMCALPLRPAWVHAYRERTASMAALTDPHLSLVRP